MRYQFPVIEHISQVLPVVKDLKEFIVAEKDDYLAINYVVDTGETFPDPAKTKNEKLAFDYAVRRECRGLIFNASSGRVISRPYHKFWNLNQKEESQISKIDVSKPHIILDKVDGSMLRPFYSNGKIRWGTKLGVTEVSLPVEDFVKRHTHIQDWVKAFLDQDMTPIFEWYGPTQQIILQYPKDNLILTAIRHNVTGKYVPYHELLKAKAFGIDVVGARSGNVADLTAFSSEVSAMTGIEGFVIRFDSGQMLKLKCDDYCRMHSSKEMLKFEKDIIASILSDKIDDIIPSLPEEDQKRVTKFQVKLIKALQDVSEKLKWVVLAAKDNLNGSKKRFATEIVANHQPMIERSILFKIWDNDTQTEFDIVKEFVRNNTGSSAKVNFVRPLMGGLKWNSIGQDDQS